MSYWGIAFGQNLYEENTGSPEICINVSNSPLIFINSSSLSKLKISGSRAPPIKSVNDTVSSDDLFGKITEFHTEPRRDFLSLEGTKNPKPSSDRLIFSFL